MARKGVLRIKVVGDSNDFSKTMKGIGGKLGSFASMAVKAGAAAAAGFGAVSVKAFADFDQAMTESLAIMGDVSDEMRKGMSDAAREVAKTTKFSATEAAESYFFLASAGLDAAESIEALPKVAAFAQAGAFDMATATDLLTDAQSALGLAVDDATQNLQNMSRVGDVLVKANTLANASVEQFSESLTEKAGAALRTVNKDIEEGVAVLGVFADQGLKGSNAGTALTRTIEGLTENARKNADVFAELGVSVFDADGEMRNMADIVGELEQAMEGMSTEQKDATIAQLGFTKQAKTGILALLGSSEAIREYESELRNAAGTVDEVAENQLESFSAQVGLIRDRLMDVAISVGSVIAPKIIEAFDLMSEAWDLFTAAASGSQAQARVARMTDSMTAVGEVANWLGQRWNEVREWLETNGPKIRDAVTNVRDRMVTFAEDVKAWWDETAKPAVDRFAERLQTFWDETAKPVLDQLVTAWNENKNEIELIFADMGRIIVALGGVIGDVFAEAEGEVQGSTETMSDDIGAVVSSIRDITDALADTIEWFDRNAQTFATISRPFRWIGETITDIMVPVRQLLDALETIQQLTLRLSGQSKNFGTGFRAESRVPEGIPGLHAGGIVTRPTLALVGEGGESEAVIPLSKLDRMMRGGTGGGDTHVTVQMPPGSDGDDVVRAIRRWTDRNGPAPFPTAS